jgi:hydrogenase maturation protease
VERIANAVLYEGYLLYPYRVSALKNRQRWNYGVVYPRAYSEATGVREPWFMQTQCLLLGNPATTLNIKARFLRLVERVTESNEGDPWARWQEASESEQSLSEYRLTESSEDAIRRTFRLAEEQDVKPGAVRRQYWIDGSFGAAVEPIGSGAYRVTVRVENLTSLTDSEPFERDAVLLHSFISTHVILQAQDGEFVSLLDPPDHLREAAAACRNIGSWPVLAGEPTRRNTMLASPIILYDYPEIAAESPGDLFDGTEIDEILTLRILTMTDEEKSEMRQTDPRAREILERSENLLPEHLMKLHGVLRAVHPANGDAA